MQLINERLKIENHAANTLVSSRTNETKPLNAEAVNEQTFFSKEQLENKMDVVQQ